MPAHVTTQFEVRTTGNDANGGGFSTTYGGTDYSQQDVAQFSGSNLTVHAADNTKVIPSAVTPAAAHVGNVIKIASGAGFTVGRYQIVSQDGSTWTLDRSPAATGTTGGVWKLGGAIATPGEAASMLTTPVFVSAGNKIWVKFGTYTLTTATPAVSGGPFKATNTNGFTLEGYQTTRGDKGEIPTLNAGEITNVTLFDFSYANQSVVRNLKANGNSKTGVNGFDVGYSGTRFVGCEAANCNATTTNYGFKSGIAIGCKATSCGYGFNATAGAHASISENCTTGFFNTHPSLCLALNCNTGYLTSHNQQISNCNADGCGTGFYLSGSYANAFNVLATNCTTGIAGVVGTHNHTQNVGFYNNTSNGTDAFYKDGAIELPGDPYVNRAGGDFRLNSGAGGQACLITFANRTIGHLGAFRPISGNADHPLSGSTHPLTGK